MQLVALAKNPVPSGAVVGAFKGHDGVPLRFARWAATRGPRQGTICVFPGRGEFIEKYFEVVADLRRRGYAVAMHDWRGQGGSERLLSNSRKGHVMGFTQYDRDVSIFMSEIVVPGFTTDFAASSTQLPILTGWLISTDWYIVCCTESVAWRKS